jgi:phosphatidylglycerol:prolipoprotein diacylglycerol transferase
MYPYLLPEIFGYTIAMYDLLIVIGIFLMFLYISNRFDKEDGFTKGQTNKILILIAASLVFALIFSFTFDGIFHTIQEGEADFGSISFLTALIGGFASFFVLMKIFYKPSKPDMKKIANTVVTGVVLAHAFGRIGCFCAGCCFGIPTESMLGVLFPYGHAHDLYPGEAVYPTQLFEAAFLFISFILLNKVRYFKHKEVEAYLIGYGIWRILIEFIRGDERGVLFPLFVIEYNIFPTPSQFMSLLMIILGAYLIYKHVHMKNKQNHLS